MYYIKFLLFIPLFFYSFSLFPQNEKIVVIQNEINNLGFNYPKKVALYNQILTLKPNDYSALLGKSLAYLSWWGYLGNEEKKLHDSLLVNINKACLSQEVNYVAFYTRGNVFFSVGEFEKSLPDFNKALELKPNLSVARWKRASILLANQQYQSAVEDLNVAMEIDGQSDWLLRMRATCYANLNELSECWKDVEKANLIDSLNPKNILLKADYFAIVKEYEHANKFYTALINSHSSFSIAYLKRGNVFFARGDIENAEKDWAIARKYGLMENEDSKKIIFGYWKLLKE